VKYISKYWQDSYRMDIQVKIVNQEWLWPVENLNLELINKNEFYRMPGEYPDKRSSDKLYNNAEIKKAGRKYLTEVNAIILDGKKIRTTRQLVKIGNDKLNSLTIIEVNKNTYSTIKSKLKKLPIKIKNKQIYNMHIIDFVEDFEYSYLISEANLLYMDLMNNFFDSKKSKGSHYVIKLLFNKLEANEIIFAASFCLRTNDKGFTFDEEVELIFEALHSIFAQHKFKSHLLIPKERVKYSGQNGAQMMFVLFHLIRYDLGINIII
jgi:hypothetical protein